MAEARWTLEEDEILLNAIEERGLSYIETTKLLGSVYTRNMIAGRYYRLRKLGAPKRPRWISFETPKVKPVQNDKPKFTSIMTRTARRLDPAAPRRTVELEELSPQVGFRSIIGSSMADG